MKFSTSDLHILLSTILFLPFVIALFVTWRKGAFTDIEDAKYVVMIDPDPDLWSGPAQEPDAGTAAIADRPAGDGRQNTG